MTTRERLREMIRAELERHHPLEVARSSLELLAETMLPTAEGNMAGGKDWTEESVGQAVEELRAKHPTLFRQDSAQPAARPPGGQSGAPERNAPTPRDWIHLENSAGPSEQPSPAMLRRERSALGASLHDYGSRASRLGHVLAEKARALRGRASDQAEAARGRTLEAVRSIPPSRYVYAAIVGMLGLSALVWMWPDGEGQTGSQIAAAQPGNTTAPRTGREPASTGSLSTKPADPTAPSVPANESPSTLVGVPEVVDTATLRVEGKVVRLFGVEWARGGQAEDLTRYLRGRPVDCRLVTKPDIYRCEVDAQDLSRAVLFNGGGRATADAPPELAAAEKHAKTERIGVWRK